MSRRLSNRVFLPVALLVLVVLFLAVPARAQDGATHAGCDAITCVEKPEGCTITWVSIPPGPSPNPIRTAEDLAEAIPDVVRVTKRFPGGDGVCDSYTWNAVDGICTGSPAGGCEVPEPGAEACGSSCFCVHPGEGFEIERTTSRPFQMYGEDGVVEFDLKRSDSVYLVSVPIGVDGLTARQLYNAISSRRCHVGRVSKLTCGMTLRNWSGTAGDNFSLEPGEAYEVAVTQCDTHVRIAPTGTHVRRGCPGTAYRVRGTGSGGGYSWGIDTAYPLPYPGLEDAELQDPAAPGAGPGASAREVAAALVEDIAGSGDRDITAQVDRSLPDRDGLCILGRPQHPVLWIAGPGMPPAEGCDVNDHGPCDLEGASIELAPFAAPVVWLDQEFVHWTDTADVYDVIYGHLLPLRSGEGFDAATEGCLASDTRELRVAHEGMDPEPGEDAYWFLVRAANAWNIGFYDQGAETGLVLPRDPGIQESGRDCP